MSASNKKKLRKELNSAQLTQKQLKQAKEDKKTKAMTIGFVAVMILIVVVAASILVTQVINRTGVFEKNTIALTVGDHELNTVEFGYFFKDAINEAYSDWYDSYGEYTTYYLQATGLDLNKSLDKQTYDEETGQTWAEYFIDIAKENAKADYALYDDAVKQGFTLSEDAVKEIDNMISNLSLYAQIYGYSSPAGYLRAMYGNGADVESLRAYSIVTRTALEYSNSHEGALTYDSDAIRAHDEKQPLNYNGYHYASYYLSYSSFLEGGTKNEEDGTTTYTDAEKDAARAAAKEAAQSLTSATNLEELDAAIAALELDTKASTVNSNVLYTSLDGKFTDWLASSERKENDITVIENTSTTTDEAGNETTVVNGYYVLLFQGVTDNRSVMGNVRHILISYETEDESENHEFTDEEKAAAKKKAEELLETWKNGEATEESFIELVADNTGDTATAETGGLYENVNVGSNYYDNFKNWALDENRKPGDTGIVDTDYGYHIMYYVGASELNYRDYLITNELRTADQKEWHDGITSAVSITEGNLSRLDKDVVLSAS